MQTFLKGLKHWDQVNPPPKMPTAIFWTLPDLVFEMVLDALDSKSLLQFASVAHGSLRLTDALLAKRKWLQIYGDPVWSVVGLRALKSSSTVANNILGLSLTIQGLRIFRNYITESLTVSWISLQRFSVRASDLATLTRLPQLQALELVNMKGSISTKEEVPELSR